MDFLFRVKMLKKVFGVITCYTFFIIFCQGAQGFAQENLKNAKNQIKIAGEIQSGNPDASTNFAAPIILTTLLKVKIVHSADLDNDGDMDILTGSEQVDRVAWLENLGNLSFQKHLISTTTNGTSKIITADLDNDGDTDIVSAAYSSSDIYWFENLGNKQFTQHILASGLGGRKSIYAAELNNDGYIDILSTSHIDHKIAWYQNNAGAFSMNLVTPGGNAGQPNSVYAGDIDNNGYMDILVSSLQGEKFIAYRNDGQGQFIRFDLLGFRELPSVIRAADLDGDHDTDIIVAYNNHIMWLRNLGQLNFQVHNIRSFYQGWYSEILDIDIADLDNDGDLDIMSSSSRLNFMPNTNNLIFWFENNGTGSFLDHYIPDAISTKRPVSIHATDLDNDADKDIVVASQENNKIFFYRNLFQLTPPTVNFAANITSGAAPLSVSFIDNSVGTYTNRHWEFGDGTTSSLPTPVHTYQTPGAYTVSLSVSGPAGGDTLIRENYIHVRSLPIADFSADQLSGYAPLTVTFSEHTIGVVDNWHWDFGDGNTSSLPNPVHTYQSGGTYTVSLTVSGPGGSDTLIRQNYITVNELLPPIANFYADTTAGEVPLRVKFIHNSGGIIRQMYWDFGDGSTSTLFQPVHTYQTAGTFSVTLIARGPAGSDTLTRENYITVHPILPPVADFSADVTFGKVPLKVQFTENTSGTVQRYFWDFGDGTISRLPNPVHFYQTKGIFSVTLIVSGPLGTDTLTRENYIRPGHNGRNLGKVGILPEDYQLHQNYPNPFNPQTVIQCDIPEPGHVSLQVFDSRGKMLRTLVDEIAPAGIHHVEWDGKDSAGKVVGSGVYFYRLKAGNTVMSRKMLLLR